MTTYSSNSYELREIYSVKPVSHQPCGSRAPICDEKFLGFVRQPHGVVNNTTRLPYEKHGARLPQYHFLCDMFGFSEIIFRQPRICLTTAARLPQGNRVLYSKAAARMPQNARLQCGTRTTYRFVLRQSCNFCMTVLRQSYF